MPGFIVRFGVEFMPQSIEDTDANREGHA